MPWHSEDRDARIRLWRVPQKWMDMVAPNSSLDHVLDLASHLTPREQAELLVRVGQRLERLFDQAPGGGSAQAILRAVDAPPHVDTEAVDDMEAAIEKGRLPVRAAGPFDARDPR